MTQEFEMDLTKAGSNSHYHFNWLLGIRKMQRYQEFKSQLSIPQEFTYRRIIVPSGRMRAVLALHLFKVAAEAGSKAPQEAPAVLPGLRSRARL